MKNFPKKSLVLIGILLLALMFFYSREEITYSGDKDTWDYLGDGRFQIKKAGFPEFKFIRDNSIDNTTHQTIVGYIEKYIENDPYIYIIGYHQHEWLTTEDQNSFYAYFPGTGEQIEYESIKNIPRYIVLNYRTGETAYYINFEEIPREDQIFFNKKVWFWCEIPFWRTCYEAP